MENNQINPSQEVEGLERTEELKTYLEYVEKIECLSPNATIFGTAEQRELMFADWAGYIGKIKNPDTTADNIFLTQKNKNSGGKAALYAPLDEVLNETRPVLAEFGFGVIQIPTSHKDTVSVQTILTHKSGAFISFPPLTMPVSPFSPQGIIAGITYARRGALNPILATHGENDDDGNSIEKPVPPQRQKPTPNKSQGKKDTKAPAKPLIPEQEKLVELANTLYAKGVGKTEINTVLEKCGKVNPRTTTDVELLNKAYTELSSLNKESGNKLKLKEV